MRSANHHKTLTDNDTALRADKRIRLLKRRHGETKLVDIFAELLLETDAAFRIYDGKVRAWIPKSQVEMFEDGEDTVFTMPEWLATEKGFS